MSGSGRPRVLKYSAAGVSAARMPPAAASVYTVAGSAKTALKLTPHIRTVRCLPKAAAQPGGEGGRRHPPTTAALFRQGHSHGSVVLLASCAASETGRARVRSLTLAVRGLQPGRQFLPLEICCRVSILWL